MNLYNFGRILSSHKLSGECKFITDFYNISNLIGKKVVIESNQQKLVTIEKLSYLKNNTYIIKFKEINSKSEIDIYLGCNVLIRDDLINIDNMNTNKLLNFKVVDIKSNSQIGIVTDFYNNNIYDIFVVEDEKYETLIPNIDKFIKKIDSDKQSIFVELIDGMKELKRRKNDI